MRNWKLVVIGVVFVLSFVVSPLVVYARQSVPATTCSDLCQHKSDWCYELGCSDAGLDGYAYWVGVDPEFAVECPSNGSCVSFTQLIFLSNGSFIQVGYEYNKTNLCSGAGYHIWWADMRPFGGGLHYHCFAWDSSVSTYSVQVDATGQCGPDNGCENYNIYIRGEDGDGYSPCTPCASTNNFHDFDSAHISYIQQDFSGTIPNNCPEIETIYANQYENLQGQFNYVNKLPSSSTYSGGAPPPDLKWELNPNGSQDQGGQSDEFFAAGCS